jgi:hypothetical protein
MRVLLHAGVLSEMLALQCEVRGCRRLFAGMVQRDECGELDFGCSLWALREARYEKSARPIVD